MGISNFMSRLPFRGKNAACSSDGETSRSEKQQHVDSVTKSPVPTLTIHSFMMGVFVSMGGESLYASLREFAKQGPRFYLWLRYWADLRLVYVLWRSP